MACFYASQCINDVDDCLRFFDFSPELVELLGGQTAVVVVVESLDEM